MRRMFVPLCRFVKEMRRAMDPSGSASHSRRPTDREATIHNKA
jgi:hypothetical protein